MKAVLVAGIVGAIAVAALLSLFASGQIGSNPAESMFDSGSELRRLVFTGTIGNGSSQLYVVNEDGSGLANLTNDDLWNIKPVASPDGTKIAYLGYEGGVAAYGTSASLYVINSDGSNKTELAEAINGNFGRTVWSPDGTRIVFEEGGQISVVNADGTGRRALTDDEHPVSNFNPVWMSDDRIAFEKVRYDEAERRFPESSFYEIKVSSGIVSKMFDFDYNISGSHVWSPDLRKIAFKQNAQPDEGFSPTLLYVMDAQGQNQTSLTSAEFGSPGIPVWAPDSNRIVFNDGQQFVQVKANDGSVESLAKSEQRDSVEAWSDDGSKIAIVRSRGEEGYSIYVMDNDGSDQTKVVELSYPHFGGSIDWLPLQ